MMTIQVFRAIFRRFRTFWLTRPHLEIGTVLWQQTIHELGRRGLGGKREAGAFLLARPGEKVPIVLRVAYFDDLDPNCLVGHIHIRAVGFSKLWDLCEAENLSVVADIHTHPNASVAQSAVDQENPMIAREGHIALIVPHYATRSVLPRDVGVHEYRGERGWVSWYGSGAERVLRIRKA
ncbi:MAG: hypothetical protein OXC17_02675 [Aestuariivita sp.]|nr:hypothetical protein [Aestuariivita sp.]